MLFKDQKMRFVFFEEYKIKQSYKGRWMEIFNYSFITPYIYMKYYLPTGDIFNSSISTSKSKVILIFSKGLSRLECIHSRLSHSFFYNHIA